MVAKAVRMFALAAAAGAASCGGQTADVGWNDEGTTPDAASVAAKCAAPDGPALAVPDGATFLSLLAGRWYVCGPTDPALGPAPAAIELTSDKSWYVLVADASGAFVRSSTPADQGTFEADKALSGAYPDSYALSLDGTHVDIVAFESAPNRMAWAYDRPPGVRTTGARYVR
jgi:hypothetical protein